MTNTEKCACHSIGRWGLLTIVLVLALGVLGWATLEQRKSIMKTAGEMKNCSTFVECVEKAGLGGVLEKDGPFSVFVPTNEAFEKIPADQLKSLLDNKSALTALLLYHMVPKKMSSSEMENQKNCLTCTVPQTSITCSEHKYGQGTCTGAPVPCTNGVIFFIDTVQIPAFLNTKGSAGTNGTPAVVEEAEVTVVEEIDGTPGKATSNKTDAKSKTDAQGTKTDKSSGDKAPSAEPKPSAKEPVKNPEKK
ncbi:MAG: fasciclin domain-containing protein [Planctomycetia bacterium]|nr:fasciclin domain-containing protein [Planctomycetia bacterium]